MLALAVHVVVPNDRDDGGGAVAVVSCATCFVFGDGDRRARASSGRSGWRREPASRALDVDRSAATASNGLSVETTPDVIGSGSDPGEFTESFTRANADCTVTGFFGGDGTSNSCCTNCSNRAIVDDRGATASACLPATTPEVACDMASTASVNQHGQVGTTLPSRTGAQGPHVARAACNCKRTVDVVLSIQKAKRFGLDQL